MPVRSITPVHQPRDVDVNGLATVFNLSSEHSKRLAAAAGLSHSKIY